MDPGTVRPLCQLLPRRTGSGFAFVLPGRTVAVNGDHDEIWAVLERCDGTRTPAEIATALHGEDGAAKREVEELLARLLAEGVTVDATQAFRLAHRQASVGSPLFRAVSDEELATLARERYEPPRPAGASLALPDVATELLGIASRRRSATPGAPREVSLRDLAAVLGAAGGRPGVPPPLPSAGGLRPLILHVLLRRPLGGAEPGLWWHDAAAGELRLLEARRAPVETALISHELSDGLLAAGEPIVFVSADPGRAARKYANRGYRYALLEAGAAMEAAYLAAAELELPIRAIGGIDDGLATELLDLRDAQVPLLALLLGS